MIAACGHDDGTNDGIVTDPQNCHFDPASIQCAPGQDTDSCLTPAQVQVVREFYQGPADPQGRLLYPGGLPYGSELGWSVFELPPSQNGGPVSTKLSLDYAGLSLPYLRYQLLAPGQLGPDPFQWQFTDQGFRSMFPAAMFMFPTVYHCGGGYANSSFDLVYPMVQWVENGNAPSAVTATDTISNTTLTRPVYPYPDIPRYNGSGDPSQASSFHPVASPGAHYTNWIGDDLFYQPISGDHGGRGGSARHSRHA